jgi:hypothetical protein
LGLFFSAIMSQITIYGWKTTFDPHSEEDRLFSAIRSIFATGLANTPLPASGKDS